MEENKTPRIALTDKERFPLLLDLSLLNDLRQDHQAPDYNFECGDRLEQSHLDKVNEYKTALKEREPIGDVTPNWLIGFIDDCIKNVPYYSGRASTILDHPTVGKQAIRNEPWNFVSNKANLNDLLVYRTSGTTGPAMDVNFSPVTQASWLPQLESVLDRYNIQLSYDSKKVAIALICDQISTITYVSLSTYLKGAGIMKINLSEGEWNSKEDRVAFIEKYNPEILTGDPFSFLSLKSLKPKIKPKALISSAMKLQPSVEKELSEYFDCPVIDIYSMTECRMIAYREGEMYRSIRPDLFFEIFSPEDDVLLPENTFGELVITGGNNPFLPLLRYRTGDYCKLKVIDGIQYLYSLEARVPVLFYGEGKKLINNIDISRALVGFPLVGFNLHQNKDSSLQFKGWSEHDITQKIEEVIMEIFGDSITMSIELTSPAELKKNEKVTNYSSDLYFDV